MKTTEEKLHFEDLMTRLEKIVARLESSNLPLEDALQAYQEGVALAKDGHERLAQAERKIEELTQTGATRPLDPEAVLREKD